MATNHRGFIFDVVSSTLSSTNNKYSEKRVTRMFIIGCMMILTAWDFISGTEELRIEIFYAWISLTGYEGWRITNEKKLLKASADKAHGDKPTTTPKGE